MKEFYIFQLTDSTQIVLEFYILPNTSHEISVITFSLVGFCTQLCLVIQYVFPLSINKVISFVDSAH